MNGEAHIKIRCRIVPDGEHKGWWMASLIGLGVSAPTKEGARRQLKTILSCAPKTEVAAKDLKEVLGKL